MLRFTFTVDIEAEKWASETMKQTFMENAQDVIQQGLNRMTVPDWTVQVIDAVELIDDSKLD